MFVSRRLCKHARAGVWVKQCRVYTISTCATWGQINNPGFLARDATKCGRAQWWDSKQIQINPSWIDLGFISPSKGIREKTVVIQLKQDIKTLLYLKAFCCLWQQKSLYFLSPVSRWQEPKQKQDDPHIKEPNNATKVRLLLLCFGKNSLLKTSKLWIRACLDFKALFEELSITDSL